MAFMHNHLYEHSIKPIFQHDDGELARLILAYKKASVSLADFGIGGLSASSFSSANRTLAGLAGREGMHSELWEKMAPANYKRLVQLISETTDSASTVIGLLEARTPSDSGNTLQRIIDEATRAVELANGQPLPTSLAPDELIPLLAWMIINGNVHSLDSLLYYTRTFRLSKIRGEVE